ncbi:MAG: HD domain-containing protein, partial [Oscillospiraceae bacterium]|nr:HD domain-containing protein [Oscillospiraceae bacterium]
MLSQAEVLRFYDHRDGLNSSSIQDITEDDAGNILIATTMGLAYVDTSDDLRLVDDPQLNREYIRRLAPGPGGVVYGLTRGGDLFTVEGLRVTAYYPAEELSLTSTINAVLPDPEKPGFVYLGTQGSDILYGDLAKGLSDCRIFSVSPQKKVNCIALLEDNLWICADNGIGYFDSNRKYTELQDIPLNRSVDQMMADFEGNLWFASSRQGVMKIVKNRFTDVSRLAGLEATVVNATCRYRDELYLGTDNGLVLLDKKFRKRETPLTNLLNRVRIRCIYADRDGYLWLCTYGNTGLVRYDGEANTWEIFNTDNGMASDRIRTCRQLSDGSLAVATTAGLNLIDHGQVTATYNNSRGISNLEILCLEETSDGRLYLGSDGDGIYIVDGSRVSRIGLEDGLQSEVILRMRQDPMDKELFWIITSNSIAYMKDEKVTTVSGFPYSNNFDLYFDDDGRLWVLSSNGVYVVSRDAMLANGEIQYTLYDFSCGLPTVATANSFSQLDENGTLYIAGSTGVCSVNINDDVADYGNVRLAVPFLTADDAYYAVPESGEVRIPSSVKRLTIHPYAFTYSLSNPHMRYQLEGFDDAPVVVTKRELGSVSYTNLDGGTYRFRLSLIDITTGEAKQTLTVTIVKSKAIHEQLWFWVLTAAAGFLVVAGFFFLYYRKKTQKLERKNEENKHLIQDISSAFAKCVDMKDAYTNGHSTRVAHYTALLASRLGKTPEEVNKIYNIALLHDIGKISIPDNILNKPGKL